MATVVAVAQMVATVATVATTVKTMMHQRLVKMDFRIPSPALRFFMEQAVGVDKAEIAMREIVQVEKQVAVLGINVFKAISLKPQMAKMVLEQAVAVAVTLVELVVTELSLFLTKHQLEMFRHLSIGN